jgi:DNA ligase 1
VTVRLEELVATSAAVAATRSRRAKTDALVAALRTAEVGELPALVSYLSGEPRQERLDLGPAAVFGVEVPPAETSTLTVADVDDAFQTIADTPAGAGSRTRRVTVFGELLRRATATEQDWLRRLAVRELRQGSLAGLLTAAIGRAADVPEPVVRRAAMLSGDLRRTAVVALTGGASELATFRLEIGTPLEPMLAATAGSVAEALAAATGDDGGPVIVEAKLDGARVQVHRDAETITVFTRNLNDVTHRLPEVVAAARSLDVETIVLDGEALALDEDGRPLAFQDTMSRVGREHDLDAHAGGTPLSVRFFDVLHVDGEDVLDQPLAERLEVLARTVPAPLRVDQLVTDDVSEAETFAATTLAAGHEGVVVKAVGAGYEAGRRGASWRKVKPVHTLDLVVLAAEWGSGRRRGWLSNLHLGALAEDGDPADVVAPDGTRFTMLGKTFKGLTDETLAWQTEQLRAREVRRDATPTAESGSGHVVHVRPELVVEIALDGFVRSTRYRGGLAMRFARVRGYRPDKGPRDADTMAAARAIASGAQLPTG